MTPAQKAALAIISGAGVTGLHSYMINPDWRTALPSAALGGALSFGTVYSGSLAANKIRKMLKDREKQAHVLAWADGYFEALEGD
jgi:hypothetical protein